MEQESISWGELAELTHVTQVEKFGWCLCEDSEQNEFPYDDCPKECIECARTFIEPEHDSDVCRFCQESGREGRMR